MAESVRRRGERTSSKEVLGVVGGLFIASLEGEPMESRERVDVGETGIRGDRYAVDEGHWSGKGSDPVTLVAAEDVRAAGEMLGVTLSAKELRRNVLTVGVPLAELVGRRFSLGGVVLDGRRPCDPCRYLERCADLAGLKDALAGRGGLRAVVVRGGAVEVGDPVCLL